MRSDLTLFYELTVVYDQSVPAWQRRRARQEVLWNRLRHGVHEEAAKSAAKVSRIPGVSHVLLTRLTEHVDSTWRAGAEISPAELLEGGGHAKMVV